MGRLQRRAEVLLAKHNHYPGRGLQNHNARIGELAVELAELRGQSGSEDLLRAAATLHDIGLLVRAPEERSYLERGWKFVRPHAVQWSIDDDARTALEHMMLFNHSLRRVPGIHPLAETFRRAIQVEHSLGLLRHGISRRFCKDLFRRLPRLNFGHVLRDFTRITLREDGPSELVPLFFPSPPTR